MKNRHGKTLAREHLPEKPCECCLRPMRWRKSWERSWEVVRYCSERCQREAARTRRASGECHRPQTDKAT